MQVIKGTTARLIGALAFASALVMPASANADGFESSFDSTFGTEVRSPATGSDALDARIAALANSSLGRIGVAAVDLETGRTVSVLGNQPFPMASTSKIAIAATFLDGVDKGRYRLSDMYPLMVAVPSKKFSSLIAPVRAGQMMSAETLIELSLTRSSNPATDALLAAIGGPEAVNRWLKKAGISDIRIDRDIATLVRDDGAVDPARTVERRDSATPLAMTRLLTGLHRGEWLSSSSRTFLLGTMARCVTGKHRIPGMLPVDAFVAHKTGTLYNTSSDVGIIRMPDGRAFALAIYVTGQGGKPDRDARIATIARSLYDGYAATPRRAYLNSTRPNSTSRSVGVGVPAPRGTAYNATVQQQMPSASTGR